LRFSTYISLYFGNDTKYGHNHNGKEIGSRMRCDYLNAAISNDLE